MNGFVYGVVASRMDYGACPELRRVSYQMTGYIGIDPAGVQAWKGQLDSAHEGVIAALTAYRTIANQNNEVARGSHFQNLNAQCDDITNKHLADHNDLHAQYTKASNDLVQGIYDVAGQ